MAPELVPHSMNQGNSLPALPFERWKDTQATLHMWTQIVGKVRLQLCPLVNHWWNVTFYVTGRGMTTLAMPYQDRDVEIRFDFVDHKLVIETSDGQKPSPRLETAERCRVLWEVHGGACRTRSERKDLDHPGRNARPANSV